ncbi:hypothetical protein [Segniliparus rugosus]|uniref:Uncharacterized protein n=1 Tax=Segniliparus rugosus (strain ATCC BAA-974 / DSM 45345 / CCUG 50838 / CIP 108380 / JCM 13579 / CDC 945) TaxID=679197 RepID=E5XQW1_SEGRC|nr:hypothetical protein [Segniliparus rugosus]EFV13252.1 hypothetical protein HMPREF9336_01914 [Segniliparus rugosus ATCC BAA-974]
MTEPLKPRSPQWLLLPRSAQGRRKYVGWVGLSRSIFLFFLVPFSLSALVFVYSAEGRKNEAGQLWGFLALSAVPSLCTVLFFVNRFRQRPRGLRTLPPLRPLGEPQRDHHASARTGPAGVRYPLRSADIQMKNVGRLLAAALLATLGALLFFGAEGEWTRRAGAGLVHWYGGLTILVGAVGALVVLVAWFRGAGRSSFAIVAAPSGIWLPSALRHEPVFWDDIAAFQRQSLALSYRARPDWDESRALLSWQWETEKCEVDVLAIIGADGEAAAYLPLDELPDPERFVRQVETIWRDPVLRAELDSEEAARRLQNL